MTFVSTEVDSRQAEVAFPNLTEAQIDALMAFGSCVKIPAGDCVWEVGQSEPCMNIIMEGEMVVIDPRTEAEIARHTKGSFSGDIDVITGRPAVVSAYAKSDLHLISVSGQQVRTIVGQLPEIGNMLLKAFLMRRALLQQSGKVGILVVGSRYDGDSLRIREFLQRSRLPMTWQDVETNPDALLTLKEFQVCEENETPVVVLPNGTMLRKPTIADIGRELGIVNPVAEGDIFDVVIIGAGPSGLAAAVYGASEGLKTILLDSEAPGGQAGTSSRIENYMGFPYGISGQDLANGAVVQAERFGARLMAPAVAQSLTCADAGLHTLEVEGVGKITTRCVILSTGARYRSLDVDRFSEFEGKGIYFAATAMERTECGSQEVAVVGAGNSAGQAVMFLAETASHVYLVVRGDDLRKSMSSYLALRMEALEAAGRLTICLNASICQLEGENRLTQVTIRDAVTGKARTKPIEAIFCMIGAAPCTEWLVGKSKVQLDEKGFILTGNDLTTRNLWDRPRPPFPLETSCPGVFAVGDVRSGSVKRVASAVGEGSMAIALMHQYLALT